jgi:hypothetical protein
MVYFYHRAAGYTLPFVVAFFNATGLLVFQVLPFVNHITLLQSAYSLSYSGWFWFYVTNIPIAVV